MKKSIYIKLIITPLLFGYCFLFAQEETQNFGALKIHDTGAIGFHENLINNGSFDDNLGVAGFYNSDDLTISGAFRPIFNDIEIIVNNHLYLDVGVGIKNNSNFIIGNVVTPRNLLDINLDYINDSFYTGENSATKVDGYAAITNKQDFVFPIGTEFKIRPLELNSDAINTNAKAAYFYESPESPSTFNTSFNTESKDLILLRISTFEFWDLNSEVLSQVKLSWDIDSNIGEIVNQLEDLRVVGWNTELQVWEDLGNTYFNGDFSSGTLTSNMFVPDTYSIITFGESLSSGSVILDNFLLTANNDGINDFLVIDAVALSPNNKLEIYNRWGRIVYEEKNYKNLFAGESNSNATILTDEGLPDGVYYYIINLYDIDIIHQGYLYLSH